MEAQPQQEPQKKEFDLIVHHRDPKTGLVTKTDPYTLRVVGEPGSNEKMRLWERPSGSGNLFDKQNNPIGRWICEDKVVKGRKTRVGRYAPEAEHIEFVRPLTADQKLAQSVIETDRENAVLKAELAALKADNEKKAPGPTPKKPEQGA